MTVRLFVVLLYVSLYSIESLAQPLQLQGTVLDTMQKPLAGATILLSEQDKNTVLSFARSNAQGRFQILIPSGLTYPYTLTARLLGYSTTSMLVDTGRSLKNYHFVLKVATTHLQEVIVRAPITQRNDTTTYDLTQFVDSSSIEKLETVLQRLPGFEVMDNGTIYFKGRRVEKLLLDGDNLFDNRYTTATRNLRATLIDKVQAIEGYQENQVLKGLKKTDVVAVNLTVAPHKRKIFAGSTEATTNFGDRYGASLNGLSYTKSVKATLIGDLNNTQAATGVLSEAEPSVVKPDFDLQPEIAGSNSLSPQLPGELPARRTIDRLTVSGATNMAVAWSETVKSRGYILAFGEREKSARQLTENYGRGAFFEIRENTDNRQRAHAVSAQHELTWSPTLHTQVQLRSWLNLTHSFSQQTLKSNLINKLIDESLSHTPEGYAQQWQITHRINDKNAVQSIVTYSSFKQQQYYNLPKLKLDTVSLSQKAEMLEQVNAFQRIQLTTTTDWLWRTNYGFSGSLQWQTKHTEQQQVVRLATEQDFPVDSLRIRLQETHHVVKGSIKYIFAKTECVAGLYLHALTAITSTGLCRNQGFAGPLLTLRHQFSPTKQLILSYKYDLEDETLLKFFPEQLLKGYRSIYQGLKGLAYWGHQIGLASYSQQDILANRRMSITLMGSRQDNSLLNAFQITPMQMSANTMLTGRNTGLLSMNGSIEQLIPRLDLVLKGKFTINAADQYVQLNSTTQRIRTWSKGYGLELNTVFNGPLLINLAGLHSVNATQASDSDSVLQTNSLLIQEKVILKVSKGLRTRLQGLQLYTRSNNRNTLGHFLDARVDYTPSGTRWAFSLEGRNLLNAKLFSLQSVSNISQITESYNLLGRWLLMTVSFSL